MDWLGQMAAYAGLYGHDYKHSDNLDIQLVEKHNYRNYQDITGW